MVTLSQHMNELNAHWRFPKKDAFEELKNMYGMLRELEELSASASEKEKIQVLIQKVSALALLHVPNSRAKIKTNFEWVAKCAADHNSRYAIKSVLACDGLYVGTDGKRMQCAPIPKKGEELERPSGTSTHSSDSVHYHAKTGEKVEAEMNYPPYKDVMLKGPFQKWDPKLTQAKRQLKNSKDWCYPIKTGDKLVYIDVKFYDQAMAMGEPNQWKNEGPRKPVQFNWEDGRKSVIMPINIDEKNPDSCFVD